MTSAILWAFTETEFNVAFRFQQGVSASRQQAAANFQHFWEHHLHFPRKDRHDGNRCLTRLCGLAVGTTTESGHQLPVTSPFISLQEL